MWVVTFFSLGSLFAEKAAAPGNNAPAESVAPAVPLTAEEKAYLLSLAREAIHRRLEGSEQPTIPDAKRSAALAEKKGCFVTLKEEGTLRGCIGQLMPQESLCDCVIQNAVNAAVKDPRFAPVASSKELKDLAIEISVLSVPQRCLFAAPEDFLNALVPLKHGVMVRYYGMHATYLPQVWEHFLSKEEFLSSLCQKGGMRTDAWKDPDAEVFVYQAEVIKE